MTLRVFFFFQMLALISASAPGSWEPLDDDMDIMALIGDDEPVEGISMIQKDSRLQAAAAAGCGEGSEDCPEDFALVRPEGEGVVLLQTGARYKLQQPVVM
mmetsp:Transcript_100400/g.178428  ORF Transcript_100400/g.178428 Transcript_100400/m.178428 type:complete len:101 (-) Transcript_100400:55-357(-)|eukprot:CAMPEP_0197653932 /NCGR_PEP_ID=MMETSP1338-20131121/37823_1 /TAXON_ID=43686 ORGANISM="Pelagodinium beii, Strain RCC1491" /NCGR_SAMPLE_ID=MMETSP1338 /ASSEMBLY_ACC=CAM_ASM_000754 /LENGTH=100 /DNA_ID=CAMNT_0043229239 /DNA_START=86 /DNA_END=388 /DNA_ORIENTATION=-